MESTSEITDSRKRGFLGFMKNRKKKTKKTTRVHVEPVQHHRRIVKAKHPPVDPPDIPLYEKNESLHDDEDAQDERDDESEIHLPVNKLPLVQHQLEIDHAEKWRQQRLDISTALRKEVKEREIKDHRLKSLEGGLSHKSSKVSSDSNGNNSGIVQSLEAISSILSVESQFPEHKRTVLERGPEEPMPVKRSKFIDETELVMVKMEKKNEKWFVTDKIRSLGGKIALPVAATAVAIVAIGIMKLFRR